MLVKKLKLCDYEVALSSYPQLKFPNPLNKDTEPELASIL